MVFILGVTLAAVLVIGLGALGALALLLQLRLRAAQDEIEALRARLAAPTVWEGLGAEWSEAQALTADRVSRPLASAVLQAPDFAAPRAWLLDPPEPGVASQAQHSPPPERLQSGRSIVRALHADGVQSSLFPAWTADAGLARAPAAAAPVPVPGAAIGAALLGVYTLTAAAGSLFSWPWLATVAVLVVLGGLMIAGFWRAERSLGVSVGVAMAGLAPWAGALAQAPAGVVLPCAGAAAAAAALWGLGRRAPALTWTAAVLTALGAGAAAALVALDVWPTTPASSGALALGLLGALGLIKAGAALDPAVRRPASALHAAALAGLAAGTFSDGAAGPFGMALAALVALTAAAARGRGRDLALISAWFGGSLGLFALSGEPAALMAMTPAAALMGALFYGAAAARAPALADHSVVAFALAAAGALTAALIADAGAAGYAAAALGLGLLYCAAAQARGGAENTDWRYWPLTVACAAATAHTLTLIAPPALAGPLVGACALCMSVLAARTRASALGAGAASLAVFAALSAIEAAQLTPLAAPAWLGGFVVAVALYAAAWITGAQASRASFAPVTSIAAGGAGLAAAAIVPALAIDAGQNRFAVLGAAGAAFALCALLLRLTAGRPDAGRAVSWLFAGAGLCAALWAWLGGANPWWGAQAAPLPAGAAQAALAAGGLLPALVLAGLAWRLGQEGKARLGFGLACVSGLGAMVYASLALRSAAHGPSALREAGYAPLEMLGLTAALAVAGGVLTVFGRDPARLAARRMGLAVIGLAGLKLVALDLHAAGLAPALAATTLALAMLAGIIAQREQLAAAWRGQELALKAPKPSWP